MLDKIVDIDKKLFVYLNSLGSETFDSLWLLITKQFNWIPLYLFIFFIIQKKTGWKKFGYYILFVAILILVCDQSTNLCKNYFQRIRPCNDEEIKSIIRIVKSSLTYSFFSGHAANSMATTVFTALILRKYYKHAYLLLLFPFVFAYSRIYLGLHFPLDILTGYTFGAILGYIFYKIYQNVILNKSISA